MGVLGGLAVASALVATAPVVGSTDGADPTLARDSTRPAPAALPIRCAYAPYAAMASDQFDSPDVDSAAAAARTPIAESRQASLRRVGAPAVAAVLATAIDAGMVPVRHRQAAAP